jgi:hypothetical protein
MSENKASGAPVPRRFSDEDLGIGQADTRSVPRRFSDADLGIGASSARPEPVTYGERQAVEDEAKVKAAQGLVGEGTKAAAYSAANAALFNIPSRVVSGVTALREGKSAFDEETYKQQKEYEEALARRNPYASGAGTAAGIAGSLFVPLGPLAKIGQGAQALVAPRLGALAGKAAETATISGALSGASSYIEKGEADRAIRDALVGAGIGAAAGPAISSLASRFSKLPNVVDPATGQLSNAAQKAVQEAFGSRLSSDDIQRLLPELQSVMGQKGISAAAAREALLAKEGVEPSRTLATGVKAPAAAKETAEEAASKAQEKILQQAETVAGPRPPEFAVAKELHAAERTALDAANAQYQRTFSHPGHFDEDFTGLVMPSVRNVLDSRNLPTSYERLPQYVYAPQAMKLLQDVSAGNMPLNQPINMRNLNEVNIGLNMLFRKATGEDRNAILAMKKGFFDSIDEGIKNNLFYGKGAQVINDMKDAHKLWAEYRKTFYGKDVGSDVFKRTLNKFRDEDGRIVKFPDAAAAESAQAILNANLLKSNMGAQVYQKLEKALGPASPGVQALNQYLRNHALDIQGNIANLPKQIDKFLGPGNISLAQKVYTPDEISQLRRLSEAAKIINARPVSEKEKSNLLATAVQRFGPTVASTAAGFFHSWPAALIAGGAAEFISGGARGLGRSMQIRSEQFGAPVVRPEITVPFQMRNLPALYPTQQEAGYGLPEENRPQRKSGGRVMTAGHMLAAAERAKKDISGKTKVLLNSSDDHVAKALEIAKQNLEG